MRNSTLRIATGLVTAVLVALLATPGASVHAVQPAADDLAKRIQARYDTIKDFSADFEQRYVGGALRRQSTERGTVQVKKPSRMRWEYTEPERKLFVADGRRLYAYVPADKQVVVSTIPTDDRASTPILFLAGKGNLTRDFSVSETKIDGAPAGTVALRLTPKKREREYDWLALAVDANTLAIRMLVAGDSQGGTSSFTFRNLRENPGLADKLFDFKIPRGTDVITQD